MYNSGDVILTRIQFTDSLEIKTRPALVLFKEFDNYIIAGITSNTSIDGIPLTKKEGAIKDSVIKLNYIFTTSELFIKKKLFSLSKEKKKNVFDTFVKKLSSLTG